MEFIILDELESVFLCNSYSLKKFLFFFPCLFFELNKLFSSTTFSISRTSDLIFFGILFIFLIF